MKNSLKYMSEQVQEGHDNKKKKTILCPFLAGFTQRPKTALCTCVTDAANRLGKQQCYIKIINHV